MTKSRSEAPAVGVRVELTNIDGPAELEILFISIAPANILRGLNAWTWLDLDGLTAVAASAFGDVFFRKDDGTICHLDTIEGRLYDVANSLANFALMLQDEDWRDALLLGGLVLGVRQNGLLLEPSECYDFRIPPILGGPMRLKDVDKLSFVVKLDVAGQLHRQIGSLPPGTRIDRVIISD